MQKFGFIIATRKQIILINCNEYVRKWHPDNTVYITERKYIDLEFQNNV